MCEKKRYCAERTMMQKILQKLAKPPNNNLQSVFYTSNLQKIRTFDRGKRPESPSYKNQNGQTDVQHNKCFEQTMIDCMSTF